MAPDLGMMIPRQRPSDLGWNKSVDFSGNNWYSELRKIKKGSEPEWKVEVGRWKQIIIIGVRQ